jgi:AcrR family transcriptional regulator
MSRAVDLKIKDEILEKVLNALSRNGLNQLSLRDIAREVDVSARMLIYHFETYDKLIHSVFVQLSLRHKRLLHSLLTEHTEKSLGEALHLSAETILKKENRNSMLFFIELYVKGLRDLNQHKGFFEEVLYKWIEEIESLLNVKDKIQSKVHATIVVSFYRGLLMDWLASKDTKRVLEASKVFTASLKRIF